MTIKAKTTKRTLKVPAFCPKCHSSKFLANVPGSKEIDRHISGRIDSFVYKRVKWQRKRCSDCGQVICQRTYYQ
jgi:hypothetical protein